MTKDRVLLVDDEVALLRTASRVLAPHYEVATAGTATVALELLADFRPDLAILDIRMPEMDGFQLMAELRGREPNLDIIFMTGIVHEVDAQLIRAIREKAFYFITKPFDREVLLTLVGRCLELRRLGRENRDHVTRLEGQLEEARRFQASLLPGVEADIAGTRIAARYHPCEALGGDFYDFTNAGAERAAFIVADVSGHGVSAAMLTGIVKSAFHDAHAEGFAPGAVSERIARALRPFDDDRFVTMFCGRVEGGTLEYANAGHPPPLLGRPGTSPRQLKLTGPMISPAFSDLTWSVERARLEAGERLLVYTDGVTEMRGEEGLYGDARLTEAFCGAESSGPELLDMLLSSVRAFAAGRPEDDDLTLLTLSR
ncbi:MAG: SpoIIE family protein phosphatase [bacterium]|nr:SpoIIE family protein phosphatase [bacterium]